MPPGDLKSQLLKKMQGMMDAKGMQGMMARGRNVYPGGAPEATGIPKMTGLPNAMQAASQGQRGTQNATTADTTGPIPPETPPQDPMQQLARLRMEAKGALAQRRQAAPTPQRVGQQRQQGQMQGRQAAIQRMMQKRRVPGEAREGSYGG